ncbi:hypothetical protein RND61_14955 [Streptomyces sp. TRM76323]|uniref:Phage protein n=1 Tax=Streptomyces tamarix TaxID=3078565 RepID=A0ABU3QLS9_9ACTN|nr:hypothetical protein [Streptomyces tamarix]MDT9683362.1 hypothetical protein [Streptomyces tamarix]
MENKNNVGVVRELIDTIPSKEDYDSVAQKIVDIVKEHLQLKKLLIIKPGKETVKNDNYVISRFYTIRLALPEDNEVFNEITLLTQVVSGYEEDITDAIFDKLSSISELDGLFFIKHRESLSGNPIRTEPITNHSFTLEVYKEEDSDLLLDKYTEQNTLLYLSNGKNNQDKFRKVEGTETWTKIE